MTGNTITQERLKELLSYDPVTGRFTRNVDKGFRWKAGSECGAREKLGYIRIGLDGIKYRAHQLAFLYTYGYIPSGHIDHISGDKSDSSIQNLRAATASQNACNAKRPTSNTSGVKGVSRRKAKWSVRLQAGNTYKSFGSYDDFELASLVSEEARNKYHGNFARIE